MATFVQIVVTGRIDAKKDTVRLNEVLTQLQTRGAKINNVVLAATTNYSGMMGEKFGTEAVYLITYESTSPISIVN